MQRLRIRKEWLMAASIPILFTVSIIGFFNFLSPESRTLGNFINYLSSLSAILMVLVVIFTTSLQLNEMESTKILQTQPFPFMEPLKKSYLEAPRFFYGVPTSKTYLLCRVFFYVSLENIGTGPAVAIDVVPTLKYTDKNGNIVSVKHVYQRIDSLKQNEKTEIHFMFSGHEQKEKKQEMHECIIKNFISPDDHVLSTVEFAVFYKNVLGASFMEKTSFQIWFYDEDAEKLKNCLKLLESAKIDYGEDMRTIDKTEDGGARHELLGKINEELSKREGCTKIQFSAEPVLGSFSVKPISEKQYQKELKVRSYPRLLGTSKRTNTEKQENPQMAKS